MGWKSHLEADCEGPEPPPVSDDTPVCCHSMGTAALMLTELEEPGEREGSGIGRQAHSEHGERFCLTLSRHRILEGC